MVTFWTSFSEELAIIEVHPTKKLGESKLWKKIRSKNLNVCSYLVQDSSKHAMELAKKVQSFHEVQS
jgi:hypothetical protein